jgi:hypothetical protein
MEPFFLTWNICTNSHRVHRDKLERKPTLVANRARPELRDARYQERCLRSSLICAVWWRPCHA